MSVTNGRFTMLSGKSQCLSSKLLSGLIRHFKRATVIGFSAIALLILAFPAQANLITNGSFPAGTGTSTSSSDTPTMSFTLLPGDTTSLPGWTDGPGISAAGGFLDCVVFPGTATSDPCGTISTNANAKFWTDPGAVPGGGNYIAIDGDPSFASTLSQTISGLTKGQTYTVSFFEGAAQFVSFTTATTEQWLVSFDTPGDCNPAMLTNSANCASQLSDLIHNPAESSTGFAAEGLQSLTFTAQATSEVLSFFAVGTPGGEPPVVLLGDVSVTATPEPGALALVGIGLLGVFAVVRRRT